MNYYANKKYPQALTAFQNALKPPQNLRAEGKNTRVNQIKYWIGCTYEALRDKDKANKIWQEVVASNSGKWRRYPGLTRIQQYLKALSQKKLNPDTDVDEVFKALTDIKNNMKVSGEGDKDYQFVRVRDKESLDQQAYPYYLAGLGHLGLQNKTEARKALKKALSISPDFWSAKIELDQIK